MIKMQLIKYNNANCLEATWICENNGVVKCHAYADIQMDMLRADAKEMGTSLAEYEALIAEVEANIKPTPPLTADELQAIADAQRSDEMLKGSTYTLNGVDYKVSFTKDDGDGMVQAENAFNRTVRNTIIHFRNGTEMPIVKDEFAPFADWFVFERNKFFIEEKLA